MSQRQALPSMHSSSFGWLIIWWAMRGMEGPAKKTKKHDARPTRSHNFNFLFVSFSWRRQRRLPINDCSTCHSFRANGFVCWLFVRCAPARLLPKPFRPHRFLLRSKLLLLIITVSATYDDVHVNEDAIRMLSNCFVRYIAFAHEPRRHGVMVCVNIFNILRLVYVVATIANENLIFRTLSGNINERSDFSYLHCVVHSKRTEAYGQPPIEWKEMNH